MTTTPQYAQNIYRSLLDAEIQKYQESAQRCANQIFWQSSCASANSYYFDKNGDVPLRPTTTLESAIRSRRFKR